MRIASSGKVGIGSTSPVASLDLSQKTDGIALPQGTSVNRPSSPANGMIRYNSSGTPAVEAFVNSAWVSLTGSGGSSQWTTSGSNINYTTGDVSIGTTATTGDVTIKQINNGDDALVILRNTDTSYTGNYIRVRNAANNADVFSLGPNGSGHNPIMTMGGLQFVSVSGCCSSSSINSTGGLSFVSSDSGGWGYASPGFFGFSNSSTGLSSSSSYQSYLSISPQINQSGTAGYAGLLVNSTESSVGTGQRNLIDLQLSGSSKFVVQSGGNVGIGTSSPSYTLHVNGSVAGTSAYNNLSDARLKMDISDITNGLASVQKLKPIHFHWQTPEKRTVGRGINLPVNEPQIGFLAQDVEKVIPEAVVKDANGLYSMEETKLIPVLVQAVKELETTNEKMKDQISVLTSEIAKLQKDIADLKARKDGTRER
jgi:hypothetical protein